MEPHNLWNMVVKGYHNGCLWNAQQLTSFRVFGVNFSVARAQSTAADRASERIRTPVYEVIHECYFQLVRMENESMNSRKYMDTVN